MLNVKTGSVGTVPIAINNGVPSFYICRYVYTKFEDFEMHNTALILKHGSGDYEQDVRPITKLLEALAQRSHEYTERTGWLSKAFLFKPATAVTLFPYVNAQFTGSDPNTETFNTITWRAYHAGADGTECQFTEPPSNHGQNQLRLV